MSNQPPAIILIEKDEITLELYQRELRKSFRVFCFTEIAGVLEALTDQDIQAVVIEPEINSGQGWELIDAIHKAFPDRSTPVIVCSTRDAGKESRDLEVTKYLTKPILPTVLRRIALEVLNL